MHAYLALKTNDAIDVAVLNSIARKLAVFCVGKRAGFAFDAIIAYRILVKALAVCGFARYE